MKLIGIIIKFALAGVAASYYKGSILETVFLFALVYGLITYYIWCFRENGFSFTIFGGDIIMTVISFCFMISVPLLVIVAPFYILTFFLPYQTAERIMVGVLIIAIIACIIRDIIAIVRMFIQLFKPKDYE